MRQAAEKLTRKQLIIFGLLWLVFPGVPWIYLAAVRKNNKEK
jgi:hypothetical protein